MSKPQVIFCTYSSVYSSIVLNTLLQSEAIEIVGIVNSTRLLKPSFSSFLGSLKFIQITGWRYSTYLFFITNLFSLLQPASSLKSVHALARKKHIPLFDCIDINTESGVEFIKNLSPDFLLSAHFNQLMKEQVLQLPHNAAINIHPSLLPAYKGVDPVFYALLRNEQQLGVSVHIMDESFDTGTILKQQSIEAISANTVFAHNMQLFNLGAKIAVEAVVSLSKDNDKLKTDQQAEGNYDSWPDRKLVKQFRKQGKQLISLKGFFTAL